MKDFVYITDKAYTEKEKEVLRMELRILEVLDFEFGLPLPLHFLRRAIKVKELMEPWEPMRVIQGTGTFCNSINFFKIFKILKPKF